MNRRIMLPVFAVIAALAIVFTTSAFKGNTEKGATPALDYYFRFNPSLSPTQDNVKNPNNWSVVADQTGCPPALERACKIKVNEDNTVDDNGTRRIKSDLTIPTSMYQTDVYYVPQSGIVLQAYNTEN